MTSISSPDQLSAEDIGTLSPTEEQIIASLTSPTILTKIKNVIRGNKSGFLKFALNETTILTSTPSTEFFGAVRIEGFAIYSMRQHLGQTIIAALLDPDYIIKTFRRKKSPCIYYAP